MNRTILYGAIGVVVLGAIAFFALSRGTTAPEMTNAEASGSIRELLAKNNVRCETRTTDTALRSTGTVYIASGKMSGDFTTEAPQGTVNTHFIADGSSIYTWQDGATEGVKLSAQAMYGLDPSEMTTTINNGQGTTTEKASPAPYNSNVEYTCEAWVPDNARFTPPSSVTFTDLSASQSASSSAGSSGALNINCSVCDQVQGEQRAQCLVALKCQ